MRNISPIALFTYNRPQHTRKTLQALEQADLAQESELFIFSDGAKNAQAVELVNKVRAIIAEPWNFKKITIIERERNIGLAQNIIAGVTDIVNRYGKIIVLEDDLEISKVGLKYFNDALDVYQDEDKVMEISGYMYPVKDADKLPETFFFRVANSWGWATWQRAWKLYNPNIDELIADFDKDKIKRFSIDHSENFWKQVKELKAGKINSWAIRWYLTLFNNDGLALYPRQSMIQNVGTDGSGTHSDSDTVYHVELATQNISKFPKEIMENKEAYDAIKYFYKHRKGSLLSRAIRFAKKKLNLK
ncbi:glycosyltransferase [Sphingobacterium composti Ten et al. 2007 non Yoo et al. 2007]|uniref:glycosyltransferase n=1 Tax=Sphingobacterium composti TaxID=363260 RepID=UPI00135C1CCC|nr:glycosyltransferase [Sphingobacterium composti Ten et al. 2007 non Yoo et al. 2007]